MTAKSHFLFGVILTLALVLSACGKASNPGLADSSSDQKSGAELYQQTCAVCHGKDAKGVPHLGKDLTTSAFVQDQNDQDLLAFVKLGRPANDPESTTGIPMPARGGNSSLTDEQILDIIAYLRSLAE